MVLGAGGFLGHHLSLALSNAGYSVVPLGHEDVDITDPGSVEHAVSLYRPSIVMNCAAISSTGYAAEHPDESYRVNVEACRILALCCRKYGVKLYVMSSDQVYSGCPTYGPIAEDTELEPTNVYGRHKYMMERKVLEILPDALVLRLPWMFEEYNSERPHTDIVSRFWAAKNNNAPIRVSSKEFRGISNVDEICHNIIRSFDVLPGGVYNFGSENRMDSYATCLMIADGAGVPKSLIVEDASWGRNISMDCRKISNYGIHFKDTIESIGAVFLK